MAGQRKTVVKKADAIAGYEHILTDVVGLVDSARVVTARVVNAVMTATYWQIGRRIVEWEQGGEERAKYGSQLLATLSQDLTSRFGKGFSPDNLENMRRFYLSRRGGDISETASRKSALHIS